MKLTDEPQYCVLCTLQEVHNIGRATVQVLPDLDRSVVVVGGDGLLLCCDQVPVDLADPVATRSTPPARAVSYTHLTLPTKA